MKTIQVCIIISTFLLLHAPASEPTNDGGGKSETKESQDSGNPTFRVIKSPDGEAYFPPGKESCFTSYYRAAKLPSMQFKREEKGKVRFRLAILPAFSKPLFLTYSREADGPSIEIKRLKLIRVGVVGSLEPGDIELAGRVVVGNRIANNLEEDVIEPEIRKPLRDLTKKQLELYYLYDGCTWILEVSTDTDYTMEEITGPEEMANVDPELLKEFNLPKVDTK